MEQKSNARGRAAGRAVRNAAPAGGSLQGKPSGAGRRLLAGVLCVLLICAGIFLMALDQRREYRHGVYRCEDGRFLEEPAAPDPEKMEQAARGLADFGTAHPEISKYMMIVPGAACIQTEYLPAGAKIRDQAADLSQIRQMLPRDISWIDLVPVLQAHAGEKLYYATAPYLTGWGSRYAASAALEGMEAEAPGGKDICYLLSDSFRGELAQDRNIRQQLQGKKEKLEIYVPENEAVYYRMDAASGQLYGSLYDSSKVDGTSQYDVFFGGEKPLTEIYTSEVNARTLLVVGDRTADSIVPRFVSSFEKIVLMHPAVCTRSLESVVDSCKPTTILFLYGANTFMTDRALLHALGQ